MKVRELIGKLTRQENVNPIERNKIPNTFVIDIPSPIASYYSRFHDINVPNTILFITKKPVSFEGILRATKNINKIGDLKLEGAKCEISIGSRKYNGIRVKGIENYTDIEKIQNAYKLEGFEFEKNKRLAKNTDSLIRINKFFNLKNIADGIYQSQTNKNRYYIEIPKDMNWDKFREVTFGIKNNISVTNYDVAKGIFYENDGISEMIRVVKPEITIEMVKEIQKKYLDKLS